MNKRIFIYSLMPVMLVAIVAVFTGCGKKLSNEEKAVAGKYGLVEYSVSVWPNRGIDDFDFYTMELKSNKKGIIKVKLKTETAVTTSKATWELNQYGKNIEIRISTKVGKNKNVQKFIFDEDTLYMSDYSILTGTTTILKFKRLGAA